ncbi:hypothetical protein [Geomesophilobacter sediminis]|uniref:Bacterial Ig domain-containing protein n=1 Tax=Geomesophilobacter sediminis TaxID=2798584 RepID=A0A8J7LYS6_9BACT|nr:hypothetical protein [Geomesophilobacter sediminis]MBJ6725377.1 hypothetical protein [Geomesophilobacter sediminis]
MNRSLKKIFVGLAVLITASLQATLSHGVLAPNVSSLGTISDRISTPVRVATDLLGNIYLSDPRAGGILKFSTQGKFLAQFNTAATPQGLAVTVTGDLVVGQGTFVAVLSSTGTEKFRLGKGVGQFRMANGIAVDQTGRIFVADSLDNCIQVFGADGSPLTIAAAAAGKPANSFGTFGSASGQFSQPTGVAFEMVSGNLAVTDTLNGRVEFFTPDGVFVKTVGAAGSGNGKFTAPEGISFSYGASGVLMYVVDAFQSNIQVLDPSSGAFVRVIGGYGTGSGRLTVPTDAVFDSFDPHNTRLVVANDTGNLTLYGVELPAAPANTGGPTLSIDPLPVATNLTALNLTGQVAAGATVKVTVNSGAALAPVASPSATSWSDAVSNLAAGNNIFTVTATDSAGRSTTVTATVLVLPPSGGAPVTPITVDALPSLVSTPLLALHGTVPPGSTVLVNGNAALVNGGSWTYQAALTEGANSLLVTASNPAYSLATTGVSVVLDSIAPDLMVSMLPTGSTTSVQRFPISGTVTDTSTTSVQVVVNGGTPVTVPVIAGSFSTAAVLTLGANTVGVTAVDAAGNASPTAVANVNLAPSAPVVTFATADGTTVATNSIDVAGAASPGSAVTVNGVAATVTGGRWSANVPLTPGLNNLVATATLGDVNSSTKVGINYNPSAPPLAVALPGQNAVVLGGQSQQIGINGAVAAGTTVSATINGAPVPIYQKPDGSFGLAFTVPTGQFGTYTVTVTAVDAAGNETTSVRELTVADPTPPAVTVESTSPLKVSVGGGAILSVRDKNGPVGNVLVYGDTASVDLTGVSYDPATLDITAVTPGGSSSRNGILVPVQVPGQTWSPGVPTVADALESLKITAGLRPAGINEKLHGDLAPLVNGVPMPDGKIDIKDTVATMMRVLGLW